MRLAILADVHGNLMALEAVMADIAKQDADGVLFAGDLQGELDYPVETVGRLREEESLHLVRGNRERYLLRLEEEDQRAWTDAQYAPLYWNFRAFSPQARRWMETLPDVQRFEWSGFPAILMSHESEWLLGKTALDTLDDERWLAWCQALGTTARASLLRQLREWLAHDRATVSTIEALPGGVYVCAHSHLQWYARFGDKLLLNPGSCGMPLDCLPGAAYTLLTGDEGVWQVEERRISYDIEAAVESLRASSLYAASPVYGDVNIVQLRTGRIYWNDLLRSVEAYAESVGASVRPYDNAVWQDGVAAWLARQGPDFHENLW